MQEGWGETGGSSAEMQEEIKKLRSQVETLCREVEDIRASGRAQVSALTQTVMALRAQLGGIGTALQEELSGLGGSTTPRQSMPDQAAAWAMQWHFAAAANPAYCYPYGFASPAACFQGSPEPPEALPASEEPPPPPPPPPRQPARKRWSAASAEATEAHPDPRDEAQGGRTAQGAVDLKAGKELMSLLKVGSSKVATSKPVAEPQPLSLDEFCLWQMQAREDAESGADQRNTETFGADATAHWTFEDNLAANKRIARKKGATWPAVLEGSASTASSMGDASSVSTAESHSGAYVAFHEEDPSDQYPRKTSRRRRPGASLAA